MSNEFTITVASNSVPLDANRQGSVAYTVFNASGRPITGRATLISEPPNQAHLNWLKVEGAVERFFTIGGAEQFTVRVAAPSEATAGNYTFRLKMVDIANTDEGVTEGPSATVAIGAPPPPPPSRPRWLIPLIAGIIALLILILAVVLLTRSRTIPMPDVVGLLETEAEGTLTAEGLAIGRIRDEASDAVAAGRIARTEPEAGFELEAATRVSLFISTGPDATPTPTATATPTPSATPTATPTPTPSPTVDPALLASYPLATDGRDSSGRADDMNLQAVTFSDGAAFCNGVYDLSSAEGCRIRTPDLLDFDFNRFTIAIEFQVANFLDNKPVFVGGRSFRWIGFYLDGDGGVRMKYNNSNFADCSVTYQTNVWHEAWITYNAGEARLYLDGTLGCTVAFIINHGNDANVGVTDYSNAQVFRGFVRNLRLYKAAYVP